MPATAAGLFCRQAATVGTPVYRSVPFRLMPSRPGRRSSPFFNRGKTRWMSSAGMAKPMPESYHSTPAISSAASGESGTSTPSTRPRMSTSGPP